MEVTYVLYWLGYNHCKDLKSSLGEDWRDGVCPEDYNSRKHSTLRRAQKFAVGKIGARIYKVTTGLDGKITRERMSLDLTTTENRIYSNP